MLQIHLENGVSAGASGLRDGGFEGSGVWGKRPRNNGHFSVEASWSVGKDWYELGVASATNKGDKSFSLLTFCSIGLVLLVPFTKLLTRSLMPVSYTHLDVYKRQRLNRAHQSMSSSNLTPEGWKNCR